MCMVDQGMLPGSIWPDIMQLQKKQQLTQRHPLE